MNNEKKVTLFSTSLETEGLLPDFEKMQDFFYNHFTRSYKFRIDQLRNLKNAIQQYEAALIEALWKDLHKSSEEAYFTEIGFVYAEIDYAIKHLKNWMQEKLVSTPLLLFPSTSKIVRDPLGIVLIIAPWNYPVQLIFAPLVAAIAAGNCAVVKPSEFTPATIAIMKKIIQKAFEPQYIFMAEGIGSEIIPALLNGFRFDHIFFTGSIAVGKEIAKMAALQLIPVTLELGGKSPCIVDKEVNIEVAAKRIAWGKFTNAGQTCVAPDYLLVYESRKEELLSHLEKNIEHFYGKQVMESPDYGRIINEQRFEKLVSFLQEGRILSGGKTDREQLFIAPTIMDELNWSAAVMQEEIFGPVLPVFTFTDYEQVFAMIRSHPDPLALYLFSENKAVEKLFVDTLQFGGACINNTLMHLGNPALPFGGVGKSGMGMYHGKFSFDTFSRPKAILKTGTWFDPPVKYPPYKGKMKYFKWFLK